MVSGGVGEALGFKDGMRRGPVSSIVRVVNGATGQPSASRPTRFLKTEAPSGSPLFPKLARDDASCGRGRRFVRRSNEAKLAAGLPRTHVRVSGTTARGEASAGPRGLRGFSELAACETLGRPAKRSLWLYEGRAR